MTPPPSTGSPDSSTRKLTLRRRLALALGLVIAAGLSVTTPAVRGDALMIGARAPEITGGPWIGSAPLNLAGLRGRVVLVEFWTYG